VGGPRCARCGGVPRRPATADGEYEGGGDDDASPLAAAVGPGTVDLLRARLRAVLLAWSAFDRDVGYVQSMNFIAALLLRHMHGGEAWLVRRGTQRGVG
jgi:hypothetical protein